MKFFFVGLKTKLLCQLLEIILKDTVLIKSSCLSRQQKSRQDLKVL